MSFAKQAADLLASQEADDAREEDRGRWRKYLGAGAGLAGLAGAGYLAHKHWGQIGGALNKALSTTPNKGIVERGLDQLQTPVGAPLAGAIAVPSFMGARRLVAHPGDSIAGLVQGSKSAPAKSPMSLQMADFNKRLAKPPVVAPGAAPVQPVGVQPADSLHSAFAPAFVRGAIDPTQGGVARDPLVDIHNLAAKTPIDHFTDPNARHLLDPRRLLDSNVASKRELENLQSGLKNHLAINPTDPRNAELIKSLQARFGTENGNPARLHHDLNSLRGQSLSPHKLRTRVGGQALAGGLGSYLLDQATKRPTP